MSRVFSAMEAYCKIAFTRRGSQVRVLCRPLLKLGNANDIVPVVRSVERQSSAVWAARAACAQNHP